MKTYVIILSKTFPATHKRHGEPTDFWERFSSPCFTRRKLHTIRANYALWEKRFKKIAAGEACLSVRQWTGAPYRSKQKELARLTREDGIGIQRLSFDQNRDGCVSYKFFDIDGRYADINDVANNDGLSFDDWQEWFKKYDLTQPLAIIHFTSFRYIQIAQREYFSTRSHEALQKARQLEQRVDACIKRGDDYLKKENQEPTLFDR